jgi:glycosyltransferase involved in cell wall biosynthesis
MTTPDVSVVSLYPRSHHRHDGRSGVASYTANLVDALATEGASVCVVAQRESGEPPASIHGGASVVRAFDRGPRALLAATRAALNSGAGVVHLQFELFLYGGPAALASLVPALRLLRRSGRRVVVTAHQVVDPREVDGDFVRTHRARLPPPAVRKAVSWLHQAVTRHSDAVVVHEPSFADVLRPAHVIPHGIEALGRLERGQAKRELGLDGRPVALCFGFVAPYKGLESVLEAARLCRDSVQVVVAGGAHPRLRDGEAYVSDLRARYSDVAVFTGYVAEPDVARWFSAADVAAYPYPRPFASSGAVALALAYETPVLLSKPLAQCLGAPEELIVSMAPRRMADELQLAVTDRRRTQEVMRVSARLSEGRSWPEVARMHRDLYEEVSNGRTEGVVGRSFRSR